MKSIIRYYPVGNGNSSQIILNNGKRLLFDFRQVKGGEDEGYKVIDLAEQLKQELKAAGRENLEFDVVAFTHGDDDHVGGAEDHFHLDHAAKYQTAGRFKMKELWVPAAFILDEDPNETHRCLRQEARHRLIKGYGIKVFSRPDRLSQWLKDKGINPDDRKQFIVDAGQLVPGYDNKYATDVEFFVHSPFMVHVDGAADIARNESSLILHATFLMDGRESKAWLIGDTTADILADIVKITRLHKREDRLDWDLYSIPHHCSHHALNEERGETITTPIPDVQYLLDKGKTGALLVSSSIPIQNDLDRKMPPHLQAYRSYSKVANEKYGALFVTGDSKDGYGDPVPLDIEITGLGCKKIVAKVATAAAVVSSAPAQRAGRSG